MKRKSFLTSSLVTSSLVALAPAAVHAQDVATLRIATPAQEGAKTLYYAIQSGMFRRAGIAIEVETIRSGAAGLAALAGGSVDIALTSMLPVFQGFARGLPFQIVAPGKAYLSNAPTDALFVNRDSPIKRGSDVNGKIVGVVTIKDIFWAGTCAWIDSTGGDSSSVKFVELPPGSVLSALLAGRIDVGAFSTPYVEQATASSDLRLLAAPFDAIAKRFEVAVWIANKPFVTANRDVLVRFGRAMHDAAHYVDTHQSEMIGLIASFTHVDPAIVAKGVRTVDPEYVDVRDLEPVLNVAIKYKLIDHPIDIEDLIAPTALRPPRQ